MNTATKAETFKALHHCGEAFMLPNPWGRGTARVLALQGFKALATSSAAYSFSCGKSDGDVAREEMMAHVAAIASATDLPVSADLENGFGDQPTVVAGTIRMAASAGAVGGSIEDATGRMADPREHDSCWAISIRS